MKITERTLRYIASLSVGGMALIMTFMILWVLTAWSLPLITFLALGAYGTAGLTVWALSDPDEEETKEWTPDDVPFYTIEREHNTLVEVKEGE